MASFVKYQQFVEDLAKGVHNLHADTLKVMLSNTAPNVATHAVRGDVTEISGGNGYTSGGIDVVNTVSETGGVASVAVAADGSWTASGGTIGPFRYVILYNDTPSSPLDPLIGYWDRGASITLIAGETWIADLAAVIATIT